jgi:oligoribonuclease
VADAEKLVWIDLEMTGLDPQQHVIVEIACVVTDANLVPLDEGVSYVVVATESQLALMDQVVIDMHTNSALLPMVSSQACVAFSSADFCNATIKAICSSAVIFSIPSLRSKSRISIM